MTGLKPSTYAVRIDGTFACPVNPERSWLHAQTKLGNWGRP